MFRTPTTAALIVLLAAEGDAAFTVVGNRDDFMPAPAFTRTEDFNSFQTEEFFHTTPLDLENFAIFNTTTQSLLRNRVVLAPGC